MTNAEHLQSLISDCEKAERELKAFLRKIELLQGLSDSAPVHIIILNCQKMINNQETLNREYEP